MNLSTSKAPGARGYVLKVKAVSEPMIYTAAGLPVEIRSLNCVKCTQRLPHAGKLPYGSAQTTSFSRPLPISTEVHLKGGTQLFKRAAKEQSFHAVLF